MPFCRDCGKSMESDWILCPYCGENQGTVHKSINHQKSKCPECGKEASSLKTCRICDFNKFCSYCHNQRKRDVHSVGFYYSHGEYYYNSKGQEKVKMYKSNGNANVKRRIETNNSCMDCSIEYFSETYLDGEDEDKNYVRLVNIWKTRSNGKETKRKVSKIFNYLEKNLNKEVSITYDSPSSGKRSRVVTPRELYFSTGREYLIALCKESNEEKSFRVDRISKTG